MPYGISSIYPQANSLHIGLGNFKISGVRVRTNTMRGGIRLRKTIRSLNRGKFVNEIVTYSF